MKADEYEKMYAAETRFWWFVGKSRFVRRLSDDWFSGTGDHLDVGCGTGATLEAMGDGGNWIGLDQSADALRFCCSRGCRGLVRGEAGRLPFGDGVFAGALCLDIFEHLEGDGAAAAEVFRVLAPGGRLIVTVPAHPFLWSSHDEALGHFRRYDDASLRRLLAGSGFSILRMTHLMGTMFPLMVAGKFWQRIFGNRSETASYDWPDWINSAFLRILDMEIALFGRAALPAGTTLAAVGEKPRSGEPGQ